MNNLASFVKQGNRSLIFRQFLHVKTNSRRFSTVDVDNLRNTITNLQNKNITNCISLLPRSIIKVDGPDAHSFLQSLISNNIKYLSQDQWSTLRSDTQPETAPTALFAGFLNSRGRLLYDVIVTTGDDPQSVYIDCNSSVLQDIISHIKKYKIRIKANITDVSNDYKVWAMFGQNPIKPTIGKSFPDPRCDKLGLRCILPSSWTPPAEITSVPSDVYKVYRILQGVPEGEQELPTTTALPFEYNFDFLNGVAYDKGCYLGQELTARTHYTGVTRKRVLPVVLSSALGPKENNLFPAFLTKPGVMPPAETPLTNISGEASGKIVASILNIGLASLRMEHTSANIGDTVIKADGTEIKVLEPAWWGEYEKSLVVENKSN